MEDTTTKPKSEKLEVIIITDSEDEEVGAGPIINHFHSPYFSININADCTCGLTLRQALEKTRNQLMRLKERRSSAD